MKKELQPIIWEDAKLQLIDQRALPAKEIYITLEDAAGVADAITKMVVRGAPAIGISAAYGVVLSYYHRQGNVELISQDFKTLEHSRPTAVNLHHALARLKKVWFDELESHGGAHGAFEAIGQRLLEEAKAIQAEDLEYNVAMAKHGIQSLKESTEKQTIKVMTHCNTGSLATGGLGTALGIIKTAAHDGFVEHVYATETRPWLQGSRLTAFELNYEGVPVQLLVEGGAAGLMASGEVDWLIVGADRITANGDVANKVGTFTLAVLAKQFGVKVMVAAPSTTVDMSLESGQQIPIEYRGSEEILKAAGYADGFDMPVYNPAFDVTPAAFIDLIVTEQGAVKPAQLASLFA